MNITTLGKLFPFIGLDEKELHSIVKELSFLTHTFEKDEVILSRDNFECEIGFLLSGECEVRRKRLKEDIILHSLKRYDSFGVLTLFSKEDYPTLIVAKKRTKVLIIKKESFLSCLNNHPSICMNVITFLASRIQFLNNKIATLSGASVEEKVKQFLFLQVQEFGTQFTLNASRVSVLLNIGRASLYRIIDKLQKDEIIDVNEKTIYIKRPEALKG